MVSVASLALWCCLCMHCCRVQSLVFYGSAIRPWAHGFSTDHWWSSLENFEELYRWLFAILPSPPSTQRHKLSYLSPRPMRIAILSLSLTSSSLTFLLTEKLLFVCSCYCTALRHTQLFAIVLSSATHLYCQCWDLTQTPAVLTATASSGGTTDVN